MKKILIISLVLTICLSLQACSKNKKEEETVDEPIGLANPVVEYNSLEEINKKIGVKLMDPPMDLIENKRYSIINDTIAQYTCTINGLEWIFRAAHITDEDISGMYSEYMEFEPNQNWSLRVNEFYLDRFFDGDKQYTIVVKDPITKDGELVLGEDVFVDCCLKLELIQKWHYDDPFVGSFKKSDDDRIIVYVERFADTYNIGVNYSISENEFKGWSMYDAIAEGDKLTYHGEEIGHYTYDNDGNELTSEINSSNNIGYFELKDETLYWTGAAQEECKSWIFEKMSFDE